MSEISFIHIRTESGDDDYMVVRDRIDKVEAQRRVDARYQEWGYDIGDAWVAHVEVVDLEWGEQRD